MACRPGFFLPVRVLSRLFRRRFLEGLEQLHRAAQLQFFGEHAALQDTKAFADWLAPMRRCEWVVYAKRPFAGPQAVLACLSRYTHRVSVAVTAKQGLVVGMRSMPDNPYDGHTVDSQLEQVEILTGEAPKIALADRGYRGVEPASGARLLISHTRRLPKRLKKLLKRRQVVEPMIGHMKADGLLGKNWLKGAEGDALHALLCGAGHNLRMILRHLRVLYCAVLGAVAMVASLLWQLLTPSLTLGVCAPRQITPPRG